MDVIRDRSLTTPEMENCVNLNRRSQPLHRVPNDKMIGGVCRGLALYFDIDTVLVRIGFVVVALIGGRARGRPAGRPLSNASAD